MAHLLSAPTVNLLIVDDDIVDVKFLKRELQNIKLSNPIHHAIDGLAALQRLRGENGQQAITEPVLILLDINMPRMNGIEFLRELRSDSLLKHHVVFVLTTSSDERDVAAAYAHHVAGYIVKPHEEKEIEAMIAMINAYLSSVRFPS